MSSSKSNYKRMHLIFFSNIERLIGYLLAVVGYYEIVPKRKMNVSE